MLCADIAQLVEHLIRNEGVVGSNPIIGSSEKKGLQDFLQALFLFCVQCVKRCKRIDGD